MAHKEKKLLFRIIVNESVGMQVLNRYLLDEDLSWSRSVFEREEHECLEISFRSLMNMNRYLHLLLALLISF